MAVSFSRPDPSSPSAVAAATFTNARKGFEPAEVREFLRMVAAELARLQERERFLEREVRTSQRGAVSTAALDEDVVTRMLGEEAARILQVAREAASQIKIRAEEGAGRLLRDATDEAQRLREEAEIESARRRSDAASDAEAELEMAKQQGREMVNEARAYRERVLSDVARRREMARQQIEQLVHGRDRLLQAFERSRLVAVDVIGELVPLVEPDEYVDLSPVTGPVPVMKPNTPRPGSVAVPIAPVVELDDEILPVAEPVDTDPVIADPVIADPVIAEPVVEPQIDTPVEALAEVIELDIPAPAEPPTRLAVDDDFDGDDEFDDDHDEPLTLPPAADSRSSADDLFARLRAARTHSVAERVAVDEANAAVTEAAPVVDATPEPATPPVLTVVPPLGDSVFATTPVAPVVAEELDDTPFARRDEALTPLIVAASRKLKRVLADEQNDVLHTLRRKDAVRSVDDLVSGDDEHAARYTDSVAADLTAAAVAGAVSMGATAAAAQRDVKKANAIAAASDALAVDVVRPLRDRLSRCVAEADGDNDELSSLVRIVYREWKNQRIDERLDDVARIAFGTGALAGVSPGTPITWTVDPNGPECADAEDNCLQGVVKAGEAFPTDH
ncbi:MAG: DivIVA domain-containing protein, partial [Actinomycetota bacterium]